MFVCLNAVSLQSFSVFDFLFNCKLNFSTMYQISIYIYSNIAEIVDLKDFSKQLLVLLNMFPVQLAAIYWRFALLARACLCYEFGINY